MYASVISQLQNFSRASCLVTSSAMSLSFSVMPSIYSIVCTNICVHVYINVSMHMHKYNYIDNSARLCIQES